MANLPQLAAAAQSPAAFALCARFVNSNSSLGPFSYCSWKKALIADIDNPSK
jgi:hypothetical protein